SYTVLNEYNIIVNKYVYGGIFMITSTWNWMWEQHDRVKDLFRFFTTANKDDMPTGTNNHHSKTTGGGNGGNYYRPAQLIGLIAGPLLFVLTLIIRPSGGTFYGRIGCACKHNLDCNMVDDRSYYHSSNITFTNHSISYN